MDKRLGLLAIVVVIVLAALALRRTPRPTATTPPNAAAAPATTATGATTAPSAAPARPASPTAIAPAATTAAAPVRFRIPHPPSLPPTATTPTTATATNPGDDGDRPALRDRRTDKSGAIKATEIHAKLDQVADDVEACLDEWRKLEPELDPHAMLTFQLDASGLGDVWLGGHADVPAGPATCFSSAVYGIDWKGLTESPVEISQRYGDD